MIPGDIGPHPDAPDYYIPMRKPANWSEGDCGTLTVRRVGATGDMLMEPAARIVRDDLPSGDSIYPSFLSEWVLTEDDKDRIADLLHSGEPIAIRVLVAGNGLPPMSLWIRGENEI